MVKRKYVPLKHNMAPVVTRRKGRQVITHAGIDSRVAEIITGYPIEHVFSHNKSIAAKIQRARGRKIGKGDLRARAEAEKSINPVWQALEEYYAAKSKLQTEATNEFSEEFRIAQDAFQECKLDPLVITARKVEEYIKKHLERGKTPTKKAVMKLWQALLQKARSR